MYLALEREALRNCDSDLIAKVAASLSELAAGVMMTRVLEVLNDPLEDAGKDIEEIARSIGWCVGDDIERWADEGERDMLEEYLAECRSLNESDPDEDFDV